MEKGAFIALEGPDGAGKTTQVALLGSYLQKNGWDVVLTREPGGTKLAEKIRCLLLEEQVESPVPVAEALLYAAARAQHVAMIIRPALAQGKLVLTDRYLFSSLAYQGYGRGLGVDTVRTINELAIGGLLPDLAIILDVEAEVGLSRVRRRLLRDKSHNGGQPTGTTTKEADPGQVGTGSGPDRMENEDLHFHRLVREGFLEMARLYPDRVRLMPAGVDLHVTHCLVRKLATAFLRRFYSDRELLGQAWPGEWSETGRAGLPELKTEGD